MPRKLLLKTVISLDGYLEGSDGGADWQKTSPEEWAEEFKLYDTVDTVLLGGGMVPVYPEAWQHALDHPDQHSADDVRYAKWAAQTRHVVFSTTMRPSDWKWWDKAEIARDAAADVPRLKREPGKNPIAYGGADFAGSLIELGLVDEYHLVVKPVLLGGGKALFGNATKRHDLKPLAAKTLPDGTVWLSYKA